MNWLNSIPVNREPITETNGAFQAYMTLLVAEEMRDDGMPVIADAMVNAARKLVEAHGRLPAGIFIPRDVYEVVYCSVVASVQAGMEDASRTLHDTAPRC